jgi:nucleoside transporter
MMVLEFFIWGAWFPLIFGYLPSLGFSAGEQSWILNTFPIAAIVGMFFSNQFADRNFSAERFLAFSHLVGGLAMIGLVFITAPPAVGGQPAGSAPFWPFFLLMLVHCLLYVPTISITNSIAFANMKDAKNEFGIVRMGGTIGWILAAWPFTFILVDWNRVTAANPDGFVSWLGTVLASGLTGQALQDATKWTFIVAGVASLLLAAYSLTLPHTPPKRVEEGAVSKLAWVEASKLLAIPFILVLWLVTFVDATVHNLYFNWTGRFLGTAATAGGVGIPGNWIMPVMSVGQIAEILTMLVLGMTLKSLGWRKTLILGILGHAVRFAVYAFFPQNQTLIILVQVVHGICYAFFFATVYIFVDEFFPKDARASAQGLFNLMILGLGPLAANFVGPKLIGETFMGANGVVDFRGLFLIPCAAAILAAIVLALFFRPPEDKEAALAKQPALAH